MGQEKHLDLRYQFGGHLHKGTKLITEAMGVNETTGERERERERRVKSSGQRLRMSPKSKVKSNYQGSKRKQENVMSWK
jgi:hypothetical protein